MEFDLHTLLRYYPVLLSGAISTVEVLVCSLSLGIVIGILVCLANLSKPTALKRIGRIYVNCLRNTPEVVIIFWVYFCLPQIVDLRIPAFATGTIALGLSAGAFLGEIFRAGIEAVPRGQREAASALGLRALPLWWFVLAPQAIRLMIPAFVSYLSELLKHSTLLSAIGVAELAHAAFSLGGQTFRYFEFFTAIGIMFFLAIFPLSLYGRYLNRLKSAVHHN